MLTERERRRKEDLLARYNANLHLTPDEAKELQELIRKDDNIDNALKLLLLFGLAILIYKALEE